MVNMDRIDELKARFENRIAEGVPNKPEYHPKDLDRVQDDEYLSKVLQMAKNDLDTALKMLCSIMKWRKESGASDINEGNIKMEYVNLGLFYPHGRDMDGCKLLIVKCKSYMRGTLDFAEVKKILIYWLDRVEREENGKAVTLFLDLDGAGLANFDIELVKYLINLFHYYPKFLHQVVIYELTWILNAPFKVVKKLLPLEAQEIMKFVNKDNILKTTVRPDQALTSWGGNNDYQFEFVPEKKNNKKVSFSTIIDRQESTSSNISTNSTISTMSDIDSTIPTKTTDELFYIEPSDKITFRTENEEMVGRIKIKNLEEKSIAFKIRTTGPEKFWVRPCSGIISTENTETIFITILPGYEKTAVRERFSVMATPSNEQKNLSEVWKTALNSDIEERRLKCYIIENNIKNHVTNNNVVANNVEIQADLTKALAEIKCEVCDLKHQVTQLKFYQSLSLVLSLISLFLGYLIYKNVNSVIIREEL